MPVSITGMHRSGTSMVAKLMAESGLYLGPSDDIMPAAVENPEGFWENVKFVELNEEILNQLGGGWDCPPATESDWSSPGLTALKPSAERVLSPFADREPWGWKDPRTCLTLPFWQELLGRIQVVLVLRNPLEVARSLRERNGFSYALGLTLWQISYQRVLDVVPVADRVITHYDAYFANPEVEYRRVLTLLGMQSSDDVIERFRQSNADRLRHHRFSRNDLASANVDPVIQDLYAALCQEAEWADNDRPGMATVSREEPAGQGLGGIGAVDLGIGGVNRLTVETEVLRQELAELRVEYHREVEQRDRQIAELSAELVVERNELEETARQVKPMERELTALRQTVGDQADHLDIFESRVKWLLSCQEELRTQLISAHEQLTYQDAGVMATLGLALARHSPGAPAAVYYRRLLEQVRVLVREHLPPDAPVAVASWGDEAMVDLDGRPASHFPPIDDGDALAYSAPDTSAILSLLELVRSQGAKYLVLPASSWSWIAQYPHLGPILERDYTAVVRADGVCIIYAFDKQGT